MFESSFERDEGATLPIEELLGEMPAGPLDYYRKKASFEWKKLKVLLECK